jgi:hypothetical protein
LAIILGAFVDVHDSLALCDLTRQVIFLVLNAFVGKQQGRLVIFDPFCTKRWLRQGA